MRRLGDELDGLTVGPLETVGFSSDAKEALAFALLARETVAGRPGNVVGATGAERAVVLGTVSLPPGKGSA
jgi:anhydro-N-acetylmuramic acid kinase